MTLYNLSTGFVSDKKETDLDGYGTVDVDSVEGMGVEDFVNRARDYIGKRFTRFPGQGIPYETLGEHSCSITRKPDGSATIYIFREPQKGILRHFGLA